MAEPKTKPTEASVEQFLDKVTDEEKRDDCYEIVKMMKQVTKLEPKMWGPSIVGFGIHQYTSKSGTTGDWPVAAFSPRKPNLVVYLMPTFPGKKEMLKKLGKHSTGVSCLYIKRLKDVDKAVLKKLIVESLKSAKTKSTFS